jgi:transcriptional regulator with GAF, ATPase, and Fis domain
MATGAPRFRSHPHLRWVDASGEHTVRLERDGIVGSAAESAIHIDHRTVSRVHAELSIRDDGLWVRDLDSRNGTHVGGVRVTGAQPTSHAPMRFGSVEVRLEYAEDARSPVEVWPASTFGELRGESTVMRELFALLARVAGSDAHVLVRGETGTGKELVARAIHDASPRRNGPFVVVDCGAFTDSLLDAELFGYAKGAFTGALATHVGAFEAADGGTVFLDEIGEVPLAVQPKLLRVLEAKTVRRLGEVAHRTVDVRVVSATHRDLPTMVASGAFREDLFFRLGVLPVMVPPLRRRAEDIPGLLVLFAERGSTASSPPAFEAAVRAELSRWPWPGNVRELRNFVERARALGVETAMRMSVGTAGDDLRTSAPPPPPSPPPTGSPPELRATQGSLDAQLPQMMQRPFREFRDAWCEEGERRYLQALLSVHHNDALAVAQAAGVDKSYVYKIMRRLGL